MFILIDKPKGITSHSVVNVLRKVTGEKRIGHAGTLDPNATGLLIIGVGRTSTKLLDKFLKLNKEYIAEITLGEQRDTDDIEGEIINSENGFRGKSQLDKTKIKNTLRSFEGQQLQIPPKYSAIKTNGRAAYKLARKGKNVILNPRKVTIFRAKLSAYNYPHVTVDFKVSSGTYIRSIARDLGVKLGCGAYLANLRRVNIGSYSVEKAVSLNKLTASNWKDFVFDI